MIIYLTRTMKSKFRKFCQQGLRLTVIWKKPLVMDAAHVSSANVIRLNVNLMNNLISEDASARWRLFTTNTWLLALRWSPIQVLSEHDESFRKRNTSYLVEKWKIYCNASQTFNTERKLISVHQLEQKQN